MSAANVYFLCIISYLSIVSIPACVSLENNSRKNQTNSFYGNSFGLSNIIARFRDIATGNILVSELELLRGIYLLQRHLVNRQVDPEKALRYNVKIGKIQREIPLYTAFPCALDNARSVSPPTSVHRLRPGDIDIIAVIGDSGSSGNNIITMNVLQILYEARSVTFTGGGRDNWRRFLTLPNILKVYNPNLYGYSIADGLAIDATSRLNAAEPTVMSVDMPFQTRRLINRMRNDPNVDMQGHWKLITIFIGSMNLCADLCTYNDVSLPLRRHERDLIKTLRLLRDNVPRLLVNVLSAPNVIDAFEKMTNIPLACSIIHRIFCNCVRNATYTDADRAAYFKKIRLWQDLDAYVATLPEFQTEQFAVVYQPFAAHVRAPLTPNGENDLRFFAQDCLHFSQLGHASMANSLWNNLLQPVGKKQVHLSLPFERFDCPTIERPYLATLWNS